MKKYMIYMAMAAVALASCSKSEISETNRGSAIEFRAAMGTRVTTLQTLGSCKVTAIDNQGGQLFSDQYNKQDDGTLVHYNNRVYYWPVDGSDVTFYAIGPYNGYVHPKYTALDYFEPENEYINGADIVVAKTTANRNTGASGVLLTFQHPLSQIAIQAKSDNSLYNFEVVGWRLAQIGTNATYDLAVETPTWTDCSEKYTYEGNLEKVPVTLDGTYKEILSSTCLIPQQLTPWNVAGEPTNASKGAYLALKVRITTKSGTVAFPKSSNAELTHDWVAIPIDTKWEPGMKYVYKVDFTNGAGYVDPSTDPDNPFNPGDEVLGGVKIGFSISVSQDWTESTTTPNNGQITM